MPCAMPVYSRLTVGRQSVAGQKLSVITAIASKRWSAAVKDVGQCV